MPRDFVILKLSAATVSGAAPGGRVGSGNPWALRSIPSEGPAAVTGYRGPIAGSTPCPAAGVKDHEVLVPERLAGREEDTHAESQRNGKAVLWRGWGRSGPVVTQLMLMWFPVSPQAGEIWEHGSGISTERRELRIWASLSVDAGALLIGV